MQEYLDTVRVLRGVIEQDRHLDEFDVSPFCQQICYGVVRNYYSLYDTLSQFLKKPLAAKHVDLKLLLLAGLYSLDHLNRPAHASVNAAVEATVGLKKTWAKGLVNGVLRSYQREGRRTANESKEAQLDHPDWLIDMIEMAWPGREDIFTNNNVKAPMTLRVNVNETSASEYLDILKSHDISASESEIINTAILLDEPMAVTDLPGFKDGLVSVQDEAPQLAVHFLNLEPGLVVLDACAAPGGKTCHILETHPNVSLTAIDRDSKRVQLINQNLERLKLSCNVVASSLEEFEPERTFERILLDVPCSATGIIRRHPDIKLLREQADVGKLSLTQRVLIDKAFDLLGTGGELLYSTCSILPAENDQVVSDFLSSNSNARSEPIEFDRGNVVSTSTGIQFLPTRDQHDGFFYARIRKVSNT